MIPQFFSRMRRPRAAAEVRLGRKRRVSITFPMNFSGRAVLFEGENTQLEHLCSLAPEAIAAPLPNALVLAEAKLNGLVDLPSLTFALVVLTDISGTLLEDRHRDLLWRAFRVPLFEHLQDWNGTVVARECETHDGLHLVPGAGAGIEHGQLWIGNRSTGRCASIVDEHCECGTETPRLRGIAPLPAAKTVAA